MKALFVVPAPHEQSLPPMQATETSMGLQYNDPITGELCGGWWCVGNVPFTDTVMVVVDTTEEMIEEMNLNPDYLFLEDITDG